MRVLLSTYGSRGDVQPMVGLALQLRALGIGVTLSAPPDREFSDLAAAFGIPFAPAFMPVREWVANARQAGSKLPLLAGEMVGAQYDALSAAAQDCDIIAATGLFPSTAAARAVGESLGLPYRHVSFCPLLLPSDAHRPFEYPGWPHPPEMTDIGALWRRNIEVMNALFGEAVNRHRRKLGLPGLDNVRDHIFTDRPWLASDPVLGPWNSDQCDAVQTGAWFLPDDRQLPDSLVAFLEAGTPPVYVGFGSMAMEASRDAAQVAIEAIRARGHRTILFGGWARLGLIDGREDCFAVGEVNQLALFRRVAAVVHHGGAGTTATAALAGAPQLIVPQVVDQPYWAARVAALGIGAVHDEPTPTSASFPPALEIALSTGTGRRAAEMAGSIRTDGAERAARLLTEAAR